LRCDAHLITDLPVTGHFQLSHGLLEKIAAPKFSWRCCYEIG
jgi:hypothetical protein